MCVAAVHGLLCSAALYDHSTDGGQLAKRMLACPISSSPINPYSKNMQCWPCGYHSCDKPQLAFEHLSQLSSVISFPEYLCHPRLRNGTLLLPSRACISSILREEAGRSWPCALKILSCACLPGATNSSRRPQRSHLLLSCRRLLLPCHVLASCPFPSQLSGTMTLMCLLGLGAQLPVLALSELCCYQGYFFSVSLSGSVAV